ncbi:MAG: arsenate reductase (glutaredoxin) [Thermoleophilia bacterium]|nr:arsenate reductase (glutaredoxin) [Thermoleophilia bacterium]MDH3724499.1 arsenate reductase (glutaredoxin) [Thermoleophilia bacterium]
MQVPRIYHNPRCGKSRGACELLDAAGVAYEVVRYLDDPPSACELHEIIAKLDQPADTLVRRETHFREPGIDPARLERTDSIVELLVEHPRLLQRPIVLIEERAIIASPPELLSEVLAG